MDRLFRIAAANGEIAVEAESLLADIAVLLELPAAEYAGIRAAYDRPSQAHRVLGIEKRPASAALKERYRELMRRYHPDYFADAHVSPEVALLLQLKTSEINEAYRVLSRKAA
jgi:DnaJ-domain-containing protein 1